jgi:hypothetical protein
MRFRPVPENHRADRRLVFIQIDGLNRDELQHALDAGLLPVIGNLLDTGHRLIHTNHPLPTNTLNFQVRFLYSPDLIVPGSRWLDRHTGGTVSITRLTDMRRLNRKLAAEYPYLLKDCSTFGSILTEYPESGHRASARFQYAPVLTGMFQHLARHPASTFSPKNLYLLFMDQFMDRNVLNLDTALASGDVSMFYINLMAYDQIGHAMGLRHPQTLNVLQKIDHLIGRIADRCRTSGYEPVLFSDHGMAPSVSMRNRYGISLKNLVHGFLQRRPGRFRLLPSGNLAHLYGTDAPATRLFQTESFLVDISSHPAFGMTVSSGQPGDIRIFSRGAAYGVDDYSWPERSIKESVLKLAAHPHSGDIILFGSLDDGRLINFMNQKACHNGWALGQRDSFVMVPSGMGTVNTDDTACFLRELAGERMP